MASVIGEKRLAAFFFWIRYENDHKDLADRLQQVLSMRYPGNVHLVADLALDANVSPDEVFFMMPIAEEILAGSIRKDERTWLEMYHMFEQWLKYVERFNYKKRSHKRQINGELVDNLVLFNPEHAVLEFLMQHNDTGHLVVFLEFCRVEGAMFHFCSNLQQLLLAKYPSKTETLIFEMWAKSGLIPKDVYRSMPIASTSLEVPGATMGKTPALDICEKLKQFLRYVDVYRSRWSFDDTEVVDVLLHFWRSAERVYGYLLLLEDLPDQMERAAQLLKVLRETYLPSEEADIVGEAYRFYRTTRD